MTIKFLLLRFGTDSIGLCIAFVLGGILVLAVTWRKTFKHRLDAARIGMQTPLSSLLLRDGTSFLSTSY